MPGNLEALLLDRMSIVVLEYAAGIVASRGNHNITEANIMSCGDTAADADHEDDSNVGEGPHHVLCDRSGIDEARLPMRHDRNDNIVRTNAAQGVAIIIMNGCFDRIVLLVKKCLRRDGLGVHSTDPTDRVVPRFRHSVRMED